MHSKYKELAFHSILQVCKLFYIGLQLLDMVLLSLKKAFLAPLVSRLLLIVRPDLVDERFLALHKKYSIEQLIVDMFPFKGGLGFEFLLKNQGWLKVKLNYLVPKYSILMVSNLTSIGIIALVPNVKLNGVSWVNVQGLVWYAHNTLGSSSIHLPLDTSNFIMSPCRIILLVTSTLPFKYGCPIEVNRCQICRSV